MPTISRDWRAPIQFVLIAVAVTWTLWFATMALVRTTGIWLEGLAIVGPTVAALWMTRHEGSFTWLARAVRETRPRWWWLLVPVGLFALASSVTIALGIPLAPIWQTAVMLLVIQILFTGIPEEIGWRGYLTPTLLCFQSPLVASLFVGVAWALWHGPKLLMIPLLPVLCLALSILMTYACVRLKGGLLLAVLIHASFNAATFWADDQANAAQAMAMLEIVIWVITAAALTLVMVKRDWFLAKPDRV